MNKPVYESPLNSRYASKEMQALFSPDTRYQLWRKLWLALAEAEQAQGLDITNEQLDEMRAHLTDIDYERVRYHEERTRHDVMAHVLAFGEVCPKAAGIIHLGATSCYVTDNADALILRDALGLIREKVVEVLFRLRAFAVRYRALPTLGFTHLQPAQPVTVGKRATLWMQDLMMDLDDLDHALGCVRMLGSRGATGTQASFMELFSGDTEKIDAVERMIAEKMGAPGAFAVSGQTYPRKMDYRILSVLSGIAQSAYKFAQDMRLLQAFHVMEEPFGKDQIGSSAMAYKRNPMRSERICSLARHVIALESDGAMTACTQWFERTLDDSANRRISLPEAFLALDAVLELYVNVADGIVVYERAMARDLAENLPFMATEDIMMECVRRGGDRQKLHEAIRRHSHEATLRMRMEGESNDLIDRLASDAEIPMSKAELLDILRAERFVGRSAEQVDRFIHDVVDPRIAGAKRRDIGDVRI